MSSPQPPTSSSPFVALPLSKLRGVPQQYRTLLKARRITSCGQLLAAAASADQRVALARAAGLDPERLLDIVRQADIARVNGVGQVFGMMLEQLGVPDVATLARQDPAELHERLRQYNQFERIARRSPTPEEVQDWIEQARALPKLLN
jgi:predicted flap endonuclease-1-like 5' DNA nuclease